MAMHPLERAARAVVVMDNRNPDAIHPPGLNKPQWEHAVPYVRAAIEAIREPTAQMCIAGANQVDNGDMQLHRRKWQAMIDTILAE